MEERVFEDEHGRKLIVRVNRSNIQIHTEIKDILDYRFYLDNIDLLKFLKDQATKVWKSFAPKEADSFGADYWEFYDKATDNNGYLRISNDGVIVFGSPSVEIMNYKGKAKYLFGLVVLISLFLGSIYPSFVHMSNHNLLYGIACMMAMDLMLGD